jgi:hypothetical protein
MVVWTVDLIHAISISNARPSEPCWMVSGSLDFECTCLMDESTSSERESTSPGQLQRTSHNYVLERNHVACRTLRVFRTCCWNVLTDVSWSNSKLLHTREGLDGKFSSSGWMMLWTVGHSDGISRRPDGWQGTRFFWLIDCAESSGSTLNSGIPVKK